MYCFWQKKKGSSAHHGLGLGIERSDKVGGILLLEPDTRPERVSGVVLENAAGGVVNEHEAAVPAQVGEGQGPYDVGPDSLDLMRFAPVDVGAAGDSGGVEDVGGLDGGDVGFEGAAVLEAAGAVLEANALGLAYLAEKAANPARLAVDQKLELPVGGGRCTVGWKTHEVRMRKSV